MNFKRSAKSRSIVISLSTIARKNIKKANHLKNIYYETTTYISLHYVGKV